MLDVVLTVPHGAPGNDVAGPPVARSLHRRLRAAGLASLLLINRVDRLEYVDGNRRESRGTPFREAVRQVLPARLLIDCHSFPDTYPRYSGKDIVLLHTPGVQEVGFLDNYRELLLAAAAELGHLNEFEVVVLPHQYPDDIVEQAVELGQPKDSNMLAEHNEQGDPNLYAAIHELAVRALFHSREAQR
jgi:hypothetical protein